MKLMVNLSEDSQVLLPLFYYPGYSIIAIGEDGSEAIETTYIDGLLVFNL